MTTNKLNKIKSKVIKLRNLIIINNGWRYSEGKTQEMQEQYLFVNIESYQNTDDFRFICSMEIKFQSNVVPTKNDMIRMNEIYKQIMKDEKN